ncbi:MAG: hypothetical protein J2P21_28165 [Chloracidobacterium sp.]|nr:hypothetical protein [Chloracidobacterium sp.]
MRKHSVEASFLGKYLIGDCFLRAKWQDSLRVAVTPNLRALSCEITFNDKELASGWVSFLAIG